LIRKFCPKRYNNFAYSPSRGASGGIIVLWNASVFSGVLVEVQRFGLIVKFTSSHNNASWTLVSVYGPCQGIERDNFVRWLYNLQIPISENWLLVGDFNFIRSHENRNKPGGDTSDMFLFNEIIGHLGLLELPLKGRAYTWSNMQEEPFWSNWIGFSLALIGLMTTLTPWSSPWLTLDLTMCHVLLILTLIYPRLKSFGLRIIGWICPISKNVLHLLGQSFLPNHIVRQLRLIS
jgi:hypothetical protein